MSETESSLLRNYLYGWITARVGTHSAGSAAAAPPNSIESLRAYTLGAHHGQQGQKLILSAAGLSAVLKAREASDVAHADMSADIEADRYDPIADLRSRIGHGDAATDETMLRVIAHLSR